MPATKITLRDDGGVDQWAPAIETGVGRGLRQAAGEVRDRAQASLAANADPWGNAFQALSPWTLRLYATEGDPRGSIGPTLRATYDEAGKRGVVRPSGRGQRFGFFKQFGNPNNRMFDNEKLAPIPARPFLPIRDGGGVDLPPETAAAVHAALRDGIAAALARGGRRR